MSSLPRVNRNNDTFFRKLGSLGIISFSEYLFLLTILIKPQSGFKIAFSMLDQDGNEKIDKSEFMVRKGGENHRRAKINHLSFVCSS